MPDTCPASPAAPEPARPIADSLGVRRLVRLAIGATCVGTLLGVLAAQVVMGVLVVTPARAATGALYALQSVAAETPGSKAPSPDQIQVVLGAALSADPLRKVTATLGASTVVAAIDTDLTGTTATATSDGLGQRASRTQQLFVVTNFHGSQRVCVGSVAWSSTTACSALCDTAGSWPAATKMTCAGTASTDGSYVLPGTQREFRFDGSRCVCMLGSGATTTVEVERVLR